MVASWRIAWGPCVSALLGSAARASLCSARSHAMAARRLWRHACVDSVWGRYVAYGISRPCWSTKQTAYRPDRQWRHETDRSRVKATGRRRINRTERRRRYVRRDEERNSNEREDVGAQDQRRPMSSYFGFQWGRRRTKQSKAAIRRHSMSGHRVRLKSYYGIRFSPPLMPMPTWIGRSGCAWTSSSAGARWRCHMRRRGSRPKHDVNESGGRLQSLTRGVAVGTHWHSPCIAGARR